MSKQKQQEIDEVSRYDMVEEDTQVMYKLVVSYVPVGVPQRAFEGELAYCGLANVQDLLPRCVAVVSSRKVVYRDLRLSEITIKTLFCKNILVLKAYLALMVMVLT